MTRSDPVAADRAKLEAALLRELGTTWDELAYNHFRTALRRPVLALSDSERRLGEWNRAQRTIWVSRALVLRHPWGVVREVLKHEMAHQYVDEVLGIHDQTAHGPAFARVCEAHGFDAAARGLPADASGRPDGAPPVAAVLRRITRLLALAESPNVHEAESAMNEARRLMLLHNIDVAASAQAEGYAFRQVGEVKGRTEVGEKILAGILARHFFVSVIWVPSYQPAAGRRGRVLELCGTAGNLDVAAYVHGYMLATADRLWRAHKRAAGIRSDRERRRFVAGVMMGLDEKLDAGARESRREGLVCRADVDREAYLRRRYPSRRSGGGVAVERTAAYEHGRRAGRAIDLQRPVGAGAAGPRLLTSG
jgi:hypothetical protein